MDPLTARAEAVNLLEEAMRNYQQALAILPATYAEAHPLGNINIRLFQLDSNRRRLADAERFLLQAVAMQLPPGERPREALFSLGIVYEYLGNFLEAERRFREAAEAYADEPEQRQRAIMNANRVAGRQ